ncbi:MAG: Gfo/Idh/MocA family oxidoreductase, partial [bacterium]|nr:Gfo/Idh/MocA family oxidoreductase [bacterium]
ISTPDHWHARMTLDALTAGKDVYLEKPMSYTIDEAKAIAREVERSGRVLQVGSQHLSDLRYHRAREVIERGWIGTPLWAQASSSRNSVFGEWNYRIDDEGTPENIDWQAFLGPAPGRRFSAERYFRWRKYWDYSGGIATDLLYHRLGPMLLALGSQFPVRVSGHGGIYVHQDREVPDTYATTIEYRDFQVVFGSSMASSVFGRHMPAAIFGHEAALLFEGGGIRLLPEPRFAKKFRQTTGQSELFIEVPREDVKLKHHDNFLKSVRSRRQPVFDATHGYRVMTAIRLGVDSYRTGQTMFFDPESEK